MYSSGSRGSFRHMKDGMGSKEVIVTCYGLLKFTEFSIKEFYHQSPTFIKFTKWSTVDKK